ncbi:nucleolar complex protein 3 homolog isoform X2 [Phycodurus eques]|uniref:nucleolar complex protein 3 homolog isoform X2 n=1 Tax=Phycodurus eques TaxID=693459 RepID=UPI002ACD85FD|nr:nucleolar complex protein 3 homolog isoform X2 [Phycodurus eques]
MAPPRSKKRRPTFRRLLKTSNMKLENKLKNRQMKRQNCDKKQRKEHKRMRQALKGATLATPRPLDVMPGRPEEEEEEDFLESLPTDMMDDDDLQQMSSFLSRDLSSCGPVHAAKKRKSEVVQGYEKFPRKMAAVAETEVVHLLPIKDKTRLIPQSVHRVVRKQPVEQEEDDEEEKARQEAENGGAELASGTPLTAAQQRKERMHKIKDRKLTIAHMASTVISNPVKNSVCVCVYVDEVCQAAAWHADGGGPSCGGDSQEVGNGDVDGNLQRHRPHLQDTTFDRCRESHQDWKQKKSKRSRAVSLECYSGLAKVAVRCLCELLLAMSHFNFHNNILVALAPLMNDPVETVSDMCCQAFAKLFRQDKVGGASLAAVRVLSGLVKSLNYNVRPKVLQTLLSVRIQEVHVKKDLSDITPTAKTMSHKDKKNKLSRMQRKWKKAEEKLQQELLEAEASDSKDKKSKMHTETLNIVFLIYFRILKKAQKSVLLPAVLEGLANFAHLINLEFFDDLLSVLQSLIQSGDLTNRESLHCIQTVFTILSGQGDVLTIDPLNFYSQLYAMLPRLHAGAPNDDISIVLRCLDAMLIRRRKQVSPQRAMAFIKRLSMLSLHVDANASVGILAATRAALHSFPKCDFLLDNELQGGGFYLPELHQPEHCNAHNTAMWELHTLQRHFHPLVRQLSSHLSRGAPSEGGAALPLDLSRRTPVQLFEDYDVKDMTFNPPVAPPKHKKKEVFRVDWSLLDGDLQRRVDDILSGSQEVELNFTATRTHKH